MRLTAEQEAERIWRRLTPRGARLGKKDIVLLALRRAYKQGQIDGRRQGYAQAAAGCQKLLANYFKRPSNIEESTHA